MINTNENSEKKYRFSEKCSNIKTVRVRKL